MDQSVSANSAPAGDAQACADASTELAVNISAQASSFDFFDASTSETFFEKNFPLLQVRRASRGIISYPVANPVHGRVGVCDPTTVSPMLLGLSRDHHAFRDGDDTDTSNSRRPSARRQGIRCPSALATQLNVVSDVISA